MSLYPPYFLVGIKDQKRIVAHNCNGGLNFRASDEITEETEQLILLAIDEGMRRKAQEICRALGVVK